MRIELDADQVDDSNLGDIRDARREGDRRGTPQQKKALLRTLIGEIRVEGHEAASLYRLPQAWVRVVATLVVRGFRNANRIDVRGHPIRLS